MNTDLITNIELVNVQLTKGLCGICFGPIAEDWAGKNPGIGTKCKDCSWLTPKPHIFSAANVDINATSTVDFDPLTGRYQYEFSFLGSKVMLNGRLGRVTYVQGDMCDLNYGVIDGQEVTEFVKGLGYSDFVRIYKEAGGVVDPPVLQFDDHVPQKCELLPEPLLPLVILRDANKRIHTIRLGGPFNAHKNMPIMETMQKFCNFYVRYRYGLSDNHSFEGGFIGRNFEVRNSMNGPGLVVYSSRGVDDALKGVSSIKELETMSLMQNLMDFAVESEQARPNVIAKDASLEDILTCWSETMGTLLRYNWDEEKYVTVEDAWNNFCKMQDVLANIMSVDTIQAVLDYAQGKRAKAA